VKFPKKCCQDKVSIAGGISTEMLPEQSFTAVLHSLIHRFFRKRDNNRYHLKKYVSAQVHPANDEGKREQKQEKKIYLFLMKKKLNKKEGTK